MGVMRVLNRDGDKVMEITETTVEEVRREFDRLTSSGHLAYVADGEGKNRAIRKFEPDADEIIVTPALVGG